MQHRTGMAADGADIGEPVTVVQATFDPAAALRHTMGLVRDIAGRKARRIIAEHEAPRGPAAPACRLTRKHGSSTCEVLVLESHAAARFRLETTMAATNDGEVSLPIAAVRKLCGAGNNESVRIDARGRTIDVRVGGTLHAFDAPWAAAEAENCRWIVDSDEPLLPTTVRTGAAALRAALRNLPKKTFGQRCHLGIGPDGIRAWAGVSELPEGEPVMLSRAQAEGPEAVRPIDRKLLEHALETIDGDATLRTGAGPSDLLKISAMDGRRNVVLAPCRSSTRR